MDGIVCILESLSAELEMLFDTGCVWGYLSVVWGYQGPASQSTFNLDRLSDKVSASQNLPDGTVVNSFYDGA